MNLKTAITWTGAALLGTAVSTGFAQGGGARISMQQARTQALKIAPGQIKSAELEKESGGSGLRYTFDIQTRNGLREIGIDAQTGKVLEDIQESAKAEAQEKRAEQTASSGQTPKISMQQARAQALKIAPGTIKSGELEKEGGGSGLRYSFDIQTNGGLREIGIDAQTGKVLENASESSRAEAKERRTERSRR